MRVLVKKIYVVASPYLAHVALRSTDLSPDPLIIKTAPNLLDISPAATEVPAGETFLEQTHKVTVEALAPNDSLWRLGADLLRGLAGMVNGIGTTWDVKDLHKWLSDGLVLGTSTAMYGPANPLAQDPTLIGDMW